MYKLPRKAVKTCTNVGILRWCNCWNHIMPTSDITENGLKTIKNISKISSSFCLAVFAMWATFRTHCLPWVIWTLGRGANAQKSHNHFTCSPIERSVFWSGNSSWSSLQAVRSRCLLFLVYVCIYVCMHACMYAYNIMHNICKHIE